MMLDERCNATCTNAHVHAALASQSCEQTFGYISCGETRQVVFFQLCGLVLGKATGPTCALPTPACALVLSLPFTRAAATALCRSNTRSPVIYCATLCVGERRSRPNSGGPASKPRNPRPTLHEPRHPMRQHPTPTSPTPPHVNMVNMYGMWYVLLY